MIQSAGHGTLADAVVPAPGDRTFAVVRDAGLVVAGTALVAVSAQIVIPWYPVPFTGQTFAVLLVAGLLGAWRAGASLGLYALVGMLGAPVFSDSSGGWSHFTGTTGGYIVGFVVAAVLVGALCERGADRHLLPLLGALLLGSAVIWGLGAWWLAEAPMPGSGARFGWERAYSLGVEPFVLGALVKLALVAVLLPAGWAGIRSLGLARRSGHEGRD